MNRLIGSLALLLCVCSAFSADRDTVKLEGKINRGWNITWERFFRAKTNLFYECLSSYERGKEQNHLPTAEEVKRQYPNPCGYATGMEDCAILGGVMLSAIVDMYEVKKDDSLKSRIHQVFEGVKLCATVHGVSGFVARGVCLEDGKSIYINSSRDQYTHAVHGLWRYYHSSLCNEETKAEIRLILSAIAERMIATVIPQNNYDTLRADGKPCGLGISSMWNVNPVGAARLPMMYAAAWNATGNEKYRGLCRKYIEPAIEHSERITESKFVPLWAILQMQCSLELLRDVEQDPRMKARIATLMETVSAIADRLVPRIEQELAKYDATMLYGDWRHPESWENRNGYMIPKVGVSRAVWRAIRETGELPLVPLMSNGKLSPEMARLLKESILNIDYEHCASCGVLFHIASYWKARLHGVL